MKQYCRFLLIPLILVSFLVAGCGVPQDEYDSLKSELDAIKEKFPPRASSSLTELNTWLASNDVSEQEDARDGLAWYAKSLEVQEDALNDGFIISADDDYFEEEDSYFVWCVAIINGRVFF